MIDDSMESVISALSNLAQGSLLVHQWNDYTAGETTRVMNVYAQLIGTDQEEENDKEIYLKAKKVMDKCGEIENHLEELKNDVLALLNIVGGLDEEKQE